MDTIQYPKEVKAAKDHKCNFCGGLIAKGSLHSHSVHKSDGIIYPWRSHKSCSEICSVLRMGEEDDYGVTDEVFQESIDHEYDRIMDETQNELVESGYVRPKFQERLKFVLSHHKIKSEQ